MKNNNDDLLSSIPQIIDKTFPMPQRFKSALPRDIAELSRLLTNKRGERALSYLNRPNFLSAYLRYFLPWNLYRLSFLLPALEINLSNGDTITDLGCGPLTFASALWITRPDLRNVSLVFNCIDRSAPALDAGKKFFTALAGESPWKINIVKKDINFFQKKGTQRTQSLNSQRTQKNTEEIFKKSNLVCAINFFNEFFDNLSHSETDKFIKLTNNVACFLHGIAKDDGSVFIVEPGVPQSGKFISLLKETFMKIGRCPLAPCTHSQPCPLIKSQNHGKKKWCHFAFDTNRVPKELHKLSALAKLPKDRLALSFLVAGKAIQKEQKMPLEENASIRVISDAFPLPENRFGRYGCTAEGLVLLCGDKNRIEKLKSLSIVPRSDLANVLNESMRDQKTGALIGKLKGELK